MVVEKDPWINLLQLGGQEWVIQIYNAERTLCKDFMYSWDVLPTSELEITDYCYHSPRTEYSSCAETGPRRRSLHPKSYWKVRIGWDFWEAENSHWSRNCSRKPWSSVSAGERMWYTAAMPSHPNEKLSALSIPSRPGAQSPGASCTWRNADTQETVAEWIEPRKWEPTLASYICSWIQYQILKCFHCPITISLQMSEFPPISWGQSHDKLLPTYTEFHFVLIHCLLQGPSKITVYGLYILVVPREKWA